MNGRNQNRWIACAGSVLLVLSLAPAPGTPAPPAPTARRPLIAPPPSPQAALPAPDLSPAFDRYAIILTRMPFGDEAAAAAAAAAAAEAKAAPVESFTKTLKMCAITKNHFTGRLQVGLVDSATKKSYFLCEGDVEDGIELKVADYAEERALLKKGDEEVWMKMSEVKSSPVVAGPGGVVSMKPPVPRGKPETAQPLPAPTPEAKPRLTGEALQKHLQSYQMELIRAGGKKGPPLPMPLTPEMDNQLVEEGVLPPP